jgi:hypothetical protein
MPEACQRCVPVLAVVAVLAAACGGSSAPSRASYGKDVDKVCATTDDRVRAIQRDTPTTTPELVALAEELGRAVDDGVSKLEAVERPDGDDGVKARRWLDELQRQVDEIVKPALADLEDAAGRNDAAAIRRAIGRLQRLDGGRVRQLARAAGARVCAS